MTVYARRKIPAGELNKFEWLGVESLWATAKSPFPVQWQRWQQHPGLKDPEGVPGIVIGGNLASAVVDIEAAATFDDMDRTRLLSRAASHIGKVTAGLISVAAHLKTPPREWSYPLDSHVATHLKIVDQVLEGAEARRRPSLDSWDYYRQLEGVAHQIAGMGTTPSGGLLDRQADLVIITASTAAKTWGSFMLEHEGLELASGATPRSADREVESLRHNFSHIIPRIIQAAEERQE